MSIDIYEAAKKQTLKSVDNMAFTDNGAVVYASLGSAIIDMNNDVMAMRNKTEAEVEEEFEKAYAENPLETVKCLFQIGDIREGKGERRTFNICMDYMAKNHPEITKELLPLIPEYTRWDYAVRQMQSSNKEVAAAATELVKNQLKEDLQNKQEGKSVSLLAKWLPSIQTKKKGERKIVFALEKELNLDHKGYRKMLGSLREGLNVMEKYLSEHKMDQVNMEALTSHQNLKYRDAFQKWAPEARQEYLNKVVAGEAKMNASVVYPYEIVHAYGFSAGRRDYKYNMDLEALWKMLPDKVQGDNSTIVIRDGSYSMTDRISQSTSASCLDVSTALSIYFAEHQSGAMKDKFITFSASPQIVDMSKAETLADRLNICGSHDDCTNTNIEKTFDLLLKTYVENNVPPEEVTKNILIVSDMQFDYAVAPHWGQESSRWTPVLFEQIKNKWKDAGYELPRMIFWQVNATKTQIPMVDNDRGLIILSGFSTNNLDMVLNGEFEKEVVNEKTGEVEKVTLTPEEQLQKILSKPRYDAVETAYKAGLKKEREYKTPEVEASKLDPGAEKAEKAAEKAEPSLQLNENGKIGDVLKAISDASQRSPKAEPGKSNEEISL